jgi:DNA-binding GntR family transcriptional regulator
MADPADLRTSTGRVGDELRHAILEGVLAPGERLRAEALAASFGTSRTPIRSWR